MSLLYDIQKQATLIYCDKNQHGRYRGGVRKVGCQWRGGPQGSPGVLENSVTWSFAWYLCRYIYMEVYMLKFMPFTICKLYLSFKYTLK